MGTGGGGTIGVDEAEGELVLDGDGIGSGRRSSEAELGFGDVGLRLRSSEVAGGEVTGEGEGGSKSIGEEEGRAASMGDDAMGLSRWG